MVDERKNICKLEEGQEENIGISKLINELGENRNPDLSQVFMALLDGRVIQNGSISYVLDTNEVRLDPVALMTFER